MLLGGERYRSLLSVGELIGAEKFRELAESVMDHPDAALRRRAQQLLNFRGKTLDSLLACMATAHGWMDSPAFAEALSGSTFSARSLFERRMTVYIVVPGHRAIESQPFVRTLLTAIIFAAFEAGADIHRPPVRFYLDEAATLGKLDLLMTLYTQGRKFGLRSVSFFQSVAQVAEITGSPDKVQTFRANMGGELFKAKDFQTAKEVSDWIGQTTVQAVSTSWQQGTNSGWSNSKGSQASNSRSGGWSESTSTTVSETGVSLIRPEEILQLREREALFVSAGGPPIKLNILDADDVRRCGDGTMMACQRTYLHRVRWRAAILLVLMALPGTAAGWAVLGMGIERLARPRPIASQEDAPSLRRVPVQRSQQRPVRQRGGDWQ